MTLRFRFPLAYGYWSLNMVEIERERLPVENLTVDGEAPTAPIGFSYYCSKKITFSNENQTLILKLENIQVSFFLFFHQAFINELFFLFKGSSSYEWRKIIW